MCWETDWSVVKDGRTNGEWAAGAVMMSCSANLQPIEPIPELSGLTEELLKLEEEEMKDIWFTLK